MASHLDDDRPPCLGVGIIGCGQAAQALHLPALASLADLFRVVHLADASAVVADRLAERLGARSSARPEDLLADPEVEVVLVAAPDLTHARFAIDACRAAKAAVLVEKPLALTPGEARAVVRVSEETRVPVVVGTMHRYDPAFRRAEQHFAGNHAELVVAQAFFGSNDEFRGDQVQLQRGPLAVTDTEAPLAYLGAAIHHAGLDADIGFLMATVLALTLTIHDLALLRATLGEPVAIEHVSLLRGTGLEAVLDYGDTKAVLLAHENAGRFSDWRFRWLGAQRQVEVAFPPSWGASSASSLAVHDLDDAMLHTESFSARHETGFRGEWRHLHDVVTKGVEPLTSAADAAADVALVERIMSAGAGRSERRDEPVRVALAGAGWITGVHGPILHALPGTTIRAVASRTMASAERRAWPYEADAYTFDDLATMLARADVDAVVVAGPPAVHAEHAVAALDAGKHVIVEKPLAHTLAAADAIVEAAAQSGASVGYAENYAFTGVVVEAARQVGAGAVGDVRSVHVHMLHSRPAYGSFTDPAWGGGVLFDLGPHAIWWALMLAGHRHVAALSAALVGSVPGETDDHAELRIDFDDGACAIIEVTWRQRSGEGRSGAEVHGSSGHLAMTLEPRSSLVRRSDEGEEELAWPRPSKSTTAGWFAKHGYVGELESFTEAFRRREPPRPSADDGRRVLEIIAAAYASAGRDEPVALPFAGPRDRTPHQLWQDARRARPTLRTGPS